MAALPSRLALHAPSAGELRDPTREELYAGPSRQLPEEIQQLPAEDTACTFCGVSYFVFAEVQALQATVKQYKKCFHQFVQFMERERRAAQDLRQEVGELKGNFAQLMNSCKVNTEQIAGRLEGEKNVSRESSSLLRVAQQELEASRDAYSNLQALSKTKEEEWKVANSLTEQKLRNEIIYLSSQLDSCKLQSESQHAVFAAERERERQKMRELETKLAEGQAHWTTAERQLVTERDTLKQKLLAVSERVQSEKDTAQQLGVQLTAIRAELTRVIATSETERKSSAQTNSELIQLKHQLQTLEKVRAQLLSEGARQREDQAKLENELNGLRLKVEHLQGQLAVNASSTEKVKGDYARELETLRTEHGIEISRLQRDHSRSIEDLKARQAEYLDYLKKETAALESQNAQSSQRTMLALEKRLEDTEREANHWKIRAQQSASESEEAKQSSSQFESMVRSLKEEVSTIEDSKCELLQEIQTLRRELAQQRATAEQEANRVEQNMAQQLQAFEQRNTALQRQIEGLQSQLLKSNQSTGFSGSASPQIAWQAKSGEIEVSNTQDPSNQESHEKEKLLEQLRRTLQQKDREISLLQQTVHRECMERTSLLERMRSGKVLPDMVGIPPAATNASGNSQLHSTSSTSANQTLFDPIGRGDAVEDERSPCDASEVQPKASFYEKLRRAGNRKPRQRK